MTRFTDDYLLYLLAQASAAASAEFHGELRAQGIAVTTWRILATLYPDAPATLGALARSCLAKQPTMTRRVDRLEQQGLVSRIQDRDGDRRQVTVALTDEGRALAARLTAMARAHETGLITRAGAEDIAALKRVLSNMIAAEAAKPGSKA